MSRLIVLFALFALSCSKDSPSPTSPPAAVSAEEAGPWQTVSINGALYRRVAAKPTETSQADLLITIPIRYETAADGSIRLSDTVQIAGRTYTADCSAAGGIQDGGDDVGDTQATATRLTVPSAGTEYDFWYSPEYAITPGDVDYFRLYAPQRMWLGAQSQGSTDVKGAIYNQDGRLLATDDDSGDGLNFIVLALVGPGTYYLRVTGARSNTSGPYSLVVGSRLPDGAGKPMAEDELEQIKAALLESR